MINRPLNIMVADDDADDQLLARQAIEQLSLTHEVDPVYNGLELIKNLEEKAESGSVLPDFILLDINMPVLNGFSALVKIRSNPLLKNIPVFILTTSQSENDQLLSSELGANGFYTKPILFDQLIHILEEIVHCAEVTH